MSRLVLDMVLDLLALGIDPERSLLFVQSAVPEHTELCWVFNTVAHHGDLERMTQFKDKAQHQPDHVTVGLFDYPVLQAADILLYKAELVPVGHDQLQHLELARRIARSFNHRYGATFPECEPKLTDVPKLLGLDGEQKMSKSLKNHIPLSVLGNDKALWKLLGPAKTDPARITREDPGDPDKCNIYSMHKPVSPEPDLAWVRQGCTTAGIGCVDCKKKLAANLEQHFAGYVEKRQALTPEHVTKVLAAGAEKARAIAKQTMREVRERLGLWPSP
jgi:tryptophanyl-tRNA synthetase